MFAVGVVLIPVPAGRAVVGTEEFEPGHTSGLFVLAAMKRELEATIRPAGLTAAEVEDIARRVVREERVSYVTTDPSEWAITAAGWWAAMVSATSSRTA